MMKPINTTEDIVLYHGSRGGLKGDIQPISRKSCDFGAGFYACTELFQAQNTVVAECVPIIYELKLHLSELNPKRILQLDKKEWVYTVLACRNRNPKFCQTDIAQKCREAAESCDIIIGYMINAEINYAIRKFSEGLITYESLMSYVEQADYGTEVVLKSEYACSKAEIISSWIMPDSERELVQRYSNDNRVKDERLRQKCIIPYRRIGTYLDELMAKEQG